MMPMRFDGARRCLLGGWLLFVCVGSHPGAARATTPPIHQAGGLPGYEIVRLGRGHFNRLCLAADVEGTKGLMIVDTGASQTALNLEKSKFLLPDANRKLPAGIPATVSVNGKRSAVALARNFAVGKLDLGPVPLCLVENRYLCDPEMLYEASSGRQYDGLLGENLLRHYRAVVDCGRMALYLNTDPSREAHLGPALQRAGWTRVPMDNLGNDFVVPCTINGHHFKLVVDTGAPFTDFDREMMRRADLNATDTNMRGGVLNARAQRVGLRRVDLLRVGEYNATGVIITAHSGLRDVIATKENQSADAPMLGLLGGDFLARNNALIDVGDHALYLKGSDPTGSASLR